MFAQYIGPISAISKMEEYI